MCNIIRKILKAVLSSLYLLLLLCFLILELSVFSTAVVFCLPTCEFQTTTDPYLVPVLH